MTPPRLLAINDPDLGPGPELDAWVLGLAQGGIDGLQIRLKDRRAVPDRVLLATVERARALFPPPGILLVNGRADVAVAAGADGVHLPASGLPVRDVRRLTESLGHRDPGRNLLIGRSTHRPEEVARARDDGADYVTFGPVYPTPSKARYGEPPGLGGLREACAQGLPVLALGGVDAGRLEEVAAAGAAGAAGIRVFAGPTSRSELVDAARRAFGPVGEGSPAPW
ncbi:MAG: thiamine phosphate synthase [Thermoanaerobaculia bacterium]